LYYGGNKNLFDFIRKHYPLIENMQVKEKYATKALDYYRKILRAKSCGEPQPDMPSKKNGYTSIFKKNSPARELHNEHHRNNNLRERRMKEENEDNDENEDDNLGNFFGSTFFGDDLFNRHKRNERSKERREREKEKEMEKEKEREMEDDDTDVEEGEKEKKEKTEEPDDLNAMETDEMDDAGMKIEKANNNRYINNDETEENVPKTQRTINHYNNEPHYQKIEKKDRINNEINERNNKDNENTNINRNGLNINQIGELNRYPEVLDIEGMECGCL